ncbi:MAG TPA: DUF2341 domain-containing protein [Candidatus Wunengus sp. YC60]|uniref:DUF2341 domain-containing protein n=1 Tax=Candidatus Wunengus sp. YC60 TaxID=3367697 RepID=UPI004027392C
MAWLTGYDYRKSVTLSRASGAVSNYQMKLLLGESSGAIGENVDCGGKCLSTFNDLRFTKADGITLLDYWIESISGTTPNQLATVWIEFDSIGTSDTTFYMYYGSSGASAVSNGANTFLFFDDFDDNSLDTDKWEVLLNTWAETGGILRGTCGASAYSVITSKNQVAPTDNYAVDATIAAQYGLSGGNYQSGLVINDAKVTATIGIGYWLDSTSYDEWIVKDESGGLTEGTKDTGFDARNTNLYSFRKNGTGHKLFVNDVEKVSHSYSWGTAPQYVGCYVGYETNYANFNNFRVRNYLATEPAWGAWGSEEALVPAALVPAAQMTLTGHAPTTNIYYLPVTLMTIDGLTPVNKATSFIPVLEMTLIGLSPYFGASPFLIPIATATLAPGNPSYIWAIPLSQQSAAKIIFSCTLTGAPDGLSDLTLPMSSFQARMRDGDPSYVSVVVPSSATYAADIVARANGEIVIKKGYLMRDGSAQMEEISRVDYESIQIDRGARNDSVTLSGHKTVTSTVASERTITGVSYYGLQANGKRRVRANFNLFLRCGDVCIYSNDPGDRFTVGNISYFVGAEPVQMIMEAGEA